MRFMKKVAGRGNLTLPRDIREAMDIDEGDIVEFEVVGVVRKGETLRLQGDQPSSAIVSGGDA